MLAPITIVSNSFKLNVLASSTETTLESLRTSPILFDMATV
jgi:hypothetical protein